ncbi:hypothetical protein F5B21DRAFT_471632 [Xylaria acuta]|nr:hypothetical protein F5B21DRAFT_471632 [Xylaria acuta]
MWPAEGVCRVVHKLGSREHSMAIGLPWGLLRGAVRRFEHLAGREGVRAAALSPVDSVEFVLMFSCYLICDSWRKEPKPTSHLDTKIEHSDGDKGSDDGHSLIDTPCPVARSSSISEHADRGSNTHNNATDTLETDTTDEPTDTPRYANKKRSADKPVQPNVDKNMRREILSTTPERLNKSGKAQVHEATEVLVVFLGRRGACASFVHPERGIMIVFGIFVLAMQHPLASW